MEKLQMASPWIMYYKKAKALFAKDPTVDVLFDEDKMEVKFLVKGAQKAEALTKALPAEKEFGNVKIAIRVYPDNEEGDVTSILHDIFDRNGAMKEIKVSGGPVLTGLNYVIFEPAVVQFFADNLMDVNGNCSTLYEDLARAVFKEDFAGVAFCTDEVPKPNGGEA